MASKTRRKKRNPTRCPLSRSARKMYKKLSDAAGATGNQTYAGRVSEIWYAKPDGAVNFRMGYDWLQEHEGNTYEMGGTVSIPTGSTLHRTHRQLGTIGERDLDEIYHLMQGESWSPRGEARDLIKSKGLRHTTMSVGDIIQQGNKVWMVDRLGFVELKPGKKSNPRKKNPTKSMDQAQLLKKFDSLKYGEKVWVAVQQWGYEYKGHPKYREFKVGRKSTSQKYKYEKITLLTPSGKKSKFNLWKRRTFYPHGEFGITSSVSLGHLADGHIDALFGIRKTKPT